MRLRTDEGACGRTCPSGRIDGKHSCTSVSVLGSYSRPFVPSEAWSSDGRFLSDAAPVCCQVCAASPRRRLEPALLLDCRRTLDVGNLFSAATGKYRSKTNCEKWKRSYAPSCRVRMERDRDYFWHLGCHRSQPLLARDRSTQVQLLSRGRREHETTLKAATRRWRGSLVLAGSPPRFEGDASTTQVSTRNC